MWPVLWSLHYALYMLNIFCQTQCSAKGWNKGSRYVFSVMPVRQARVYEHHVHVRLSDPNPNLANLILCIME